MMPTREVMSLTQALTHWRPLPTLVPSQQLGVASCAQTLRRQQSGLPKRSSEKRCGPLVASLSGISGRRPSWGGLVIVTRLCGGTTMKSSRQSGILLSVRTTAPLKWTKWWSKLTNCSRLKRWPMGRTSTPGSMRLRSLGERRPLCSCWSSSMLTSTSCLRRAWATPWSACRAFIWAKLSGALTCLPVWAWRHSAPAALNYAEIQKQLPSTSGMAIVFDICWAFASMKAKNILDHWAKCKTRHSKEHMEHNTHEGHRKALKSHKKNKSQVARTKWSVRVAQKSCWEECHSMSSLLLPSQSSEQMLILSLNHLKFVFEWAFAKSDELSHPFH